MKNNLSVKNGSALSSRFYTAILVWVMCTISINAQLKDILTEGLKTVDQINQSILNITSLSDEEENKIGTELEKEVLKGKKVVKEYKFSISKIFSNLKPYVKRKSINYGYKVVKDTAVNAYAIAGGRMFVNSGLINFLTNEDEIAYVIAHEISHNELKHCANRIQYAVRASKINPVLGSVVSIAYGIYRTPFSKEDEFAADENGVKLMQQAGYNVSGAISALEKIAKLEDRYEANKRGALNDFIASHPLAKQRIERIKKNSK